MQPSRSLRRGVAPVVARSRRPPIRALLGPLAVAMIVSSWQAAAAGEPPSAGDPGAPSQREVMTARGFVRYRSAWRTVQAIEVIERAERAGDAQRAWATRLERLRQRLDAPAQAAAAAEELREISDPAAVPALAAALAAEPQPRVRACYVEALSHVRAHEGAAALVVVAIDHVDPETRLLAVERLAAIGRDAFVPPLAAALAGDDNARINRAAEALGRLGSTAAVGPLIDALETEHVVVVGDGTSAGAMSATFTPSGGGLSMGGGPKRRKQRVQNQRVLDALVSLTGANFEWNAAAWRAWLAGRQSPPDFDPRRG